MNLWLLTYAYVPDMLERREPHRAEHLALIDRMLSDRRLLLAGALGDPPSGGALAFAERAAAEQFIAADPYVEAGLVTSHEIRPWKIVAHRPLE